MKAYQVIESGKPLELNEFDTPKPEGEEVLLKTIACGVCHSDVHIHEGAFDLGGGNKLPLPLQMPYTLGHEIFGEVIELGPDAKNINIGDKRVIYPWIGCNQCDVCSSGDEHLCPGGPVLGVQKGGGFGDHVLVPHSRYLMDAGNTPDHLAGSYACSGLTAYTSLKKANIKDSDNSLIIVGAGGLGMMGIQIAKAAFNVKPIVVDVDETKLEIALQSGASHAINSRDEDAAERIYAITGGAAAVIDFVGSDLSTGFATNLLRKGGKYIIVGLYGGELNHPLPMMVLMERNIQGSYVGSLSNMKELMALVKEDKIDPIPVEKRHASEANQTLIDLKEGKIVGRAALMHD
jgi:D-arabinose 1-dehydrogenase-like Zn-dependent alcohol dehydrogenase